MVKVYLISSSDGFDKKYKIGYTKRDIIDRINQLRTGNHQTLSIEACYETKWATKIEALLHRQYRHRKIQGEWFDLPQEIVENFLIECRNLEHYYEDLIKNSTFNNPKTYML